MYAILYKCFLIALWFLPRVMLKRVMFALALVSIVLMNPFARFSIYHFCFGVLIGLFYSFLSFFFRNIDKIRIVPKIKINIKKTNYLLVLLIVFIEELVWRDLLIFFSNGIIDLVLNVLVFVLLHIKHKKEIIIVNVIEMLLISVILTYFAIMFSTPWISIGIHLSRNIISKKVIMDFSPN